MHYTQVAVFGVIVLVTMVTFSNAQYCPPRIFVSLDCRNVDRCKITSQADCREGEEYWYPGRVRSCCGACVKRSLEKDEACSNDMMDSHVNGCKSGLCCSREKTCVVNAEPEDY
ncbi:uncharacterized protein [Periplaneta americana]|uniref:uncharacterized protein n=1 Tax=Periplaneta americana TaxID=6978 RepID=UPI0037E9C3D3